MSKKEYNRLEWKLEKIYCYDEGKWRYQPLFKDRWFFFFKDWFYIVSSDLRWCKYPHVNDDNYYKKCGDCNYIGFDSPEKAQEFIDCYEAYRKKMIDVANELKYDKYVRAK